MRIIDCSLRSLQTRPGTGSEVAACSLGGFARHAHAGDCDRLSIRRRDAHRHRVRSKARAVLEVVVRLPGRALPSLSSINTDIERRHFGVTVDDLHREPVLRGARLVAHRQWCRDSAWNDRPSDRNFSSADKSNVWKGVLVEIEMICAASWTLVRDLCAAGDCQHGSRCLPCGNGNEDPAFRRHIVLGVSRLRCKSKGNNDQQESTHHRFDCSSRSSHGDAGTADVCASPVGVRHCCSVDSAWERVVGETTHASICVSTIVCCLAGEDCCCACCG